MNEETSRFETQTLVHVFQHCTQDSSVVASTMKLAVQTVHKDQPDLKDVFFRSENNGCYHSAVTLQAVPPMCRRYDFSEPQGGKGACDRMASTIKSHISIYINEGNDVETAEQFQKAVESNGGVSGVQVFVCETEGKVTGTKPIENITQFTNFEYVDDVVHAWRGFGIEPAITLLPEQLGKVEPPSLTIQRGPLLQGKFKEIHARKIPAACESGKQPSKSAQDDAAPQELFPCPEEGCIDSYKTFSDLNDHLLCDNHTRLLEKHTLHDKVKLLYAQKLQAEAGVIPCIEANVIPARGTVQPLPSSWAVQKLRKSKHFNKNQKDFLNEKFNQGQVSGKKCDPAIVAKEMRLKKDTQGIRMFTASEFLTVQQISSYFSRIASKGRAEALVEDDRDRHNKQLLVSVLEAVGLEHPIMSNTFNICELVRSGKLQSWLQTVEKFVMILILTPKI